MATCRNRQRVGTIIGKQEVREAEHCKQWKLRHEFTFTRRKVTNICRAFLDTIGGNPFYA